MSNEEKKETIGQETKSEQKQDTSAQKEDSTDNSQVADDVSWDDKTKKYIQDLRKESAKYRTEAKEVKTTLNQLSERYGRIEQGLKQMLGQDDKQVDPEVQVQQLSQAVEAKELESAIKDIAIEYGVKGGEQYSYLKFLLGEKMSQLEEGEEVTEEDIKSITGQVQKVYGNVSTQTSVSGGTAPNPMIKSEITPEQFSKMGVLEKSDLYSKNKPLYEGLFKLAIEKKLL